MSRARPRYWPLTGIALVSLVAGVAGLLLDDDLTEMGRSLRDWQTYLLCIVTGLLLLAVVASTRRRHRDGSG